MGEPGFTTIGQIDLYGVPEYDPDAHGTGVTVKSYPNVPNTDWLEVYYDAKNYSGSGDVQDETTNNRDAEMNATFDNGEIKAFNFTGAHTSNVTTSDHGLGTGDVPYTVSYWFKRIRERNNYDYLYIMGNGGSTGQASLMWILNDQLYLDHWSSKTRYNEPIQNNRWYHVVAGHKGGAAVTNDFLFIDGQNVGVSVSTPQTFYLQGSKLTLGTSHNTVNEFLEGSIANFRLFNRALTSDDIYQLYAYQKEYFGHGDLSMTLKAGRLGIGTSEPRAALDVRGGLDVRGAIISGLPWFYGRNKTQLTTGSTSYNVTSTHLQESNDTLGTMYSTSYACLFPIKGIYVVNTRVHSVFGSAHTAYFDGVIRYSNGTTYYNVDSNDTASYGNNHDNYTDHTWLITTKEDNMYFQLNHITSAAVQRNYLGYHGQIRGACIYAL